MLRKSVLKSVISVMLVVTILISCTFSASARRAFFEVDSSEWVTSNDDIYRQIYPKRIDRFTFIDEVYEVSQFDDTSYVVSTDWYDYNVDYDYEFVFPELPEPDTDSVIFQYKDSYLLCTGFDGDVLKLICNYDTEPFQYSFVNTSASTKTFSMYSCTYPFDAWTSIGGGAVDGNRNYDLTADLIYVWASCPVYDYSNFNLVYLEAGSDTFLTSVHVHKILIDTLYVTSGVLLFQIPVDVMRSLSGKDTAFLFEDFGYITAANTSFIDFRYSMTFRDNGNIISSAQFMDYKYLGFIDDEYLEPAEHQIFDYVGPVDFRELDTSGTTIDIIVSFSFVSDGYNLFFPGSFSILDYTEYVTESNHNEVINQITAVGSQITSAVGKVNTTLEYIVSGDIGVPQPDINTSELDNVVQEQDEIIGDILSSLDDDISDYVPYGYDSYADYLIDNINSFKSDDFDNTFTFIRSTFDSLVTSLSILPLMLFSLSFGFAVFAIGRRLR